MIRLKRIRVCPLCKQRFVGKEFTEHIKAGLDEVQQIHPGALAIGKQRIGLTTWHYGTLYDGQIIVTPYQVAP
jgi:hypothetical protein